MSECPEAIDAHETRVPSGESAECEMASPGTIVIWRAAARPSSGAIQRFRLPLALLNRAVRPSLGPNSVSYDAFYPGELAQPDLDTLLQNIYGKFRRSSWS